MQAVEGSPPVQVILVGIHNRNCEQQHQLHGHLAQGTLSGTPCQVPHDLSPTPLPHPTIPSAKAQRDGDAPGGLLFPLFTLKALKSRQYQGFLLHLR